MSRQLWLRSRDRVRHETDSRPIEGAVLEDRADTMMDMVRNHVRAAAAEQRDAAAPDEGFLPDHLLEVSRDGIHSPHEDEHPFMEAALGGMEIAPVVPEPAPEAAPEAEVATATAEVVNPGDSTQA